MKKILTEETEKWMTNRDKKLQPKPGMFWCDCDCNHVWTWKKCELCHRRVGRRRFKK